jgi:hypothetical protein|tara:strand:+ start:202 stop:426 length:225 start_codon:yes stop_codon:yes gene_type:complete
MESNAILATVTDVIDTKTGNTQYRNLLFESTVVETDTEFRIDTYNVKCVPIDVANQYSKALKSGKVCKSYTTVR